MGKGGDITHSLISNLKFYLWMYFWVWMYFQKSKKVSVYWYVNTSFHFKLNKIYIWDIITKIVQHKGGISIINNSFQFYWFHEEELVYYSDSHKNIQLKVVLIVKPVFIFHICGRKKKNECLDKFNTDVCHSLTIMILILCVLS